jgi:hypothetical protein
LQRYRFPCAGGAGDKPVAIGAAEDEALRLAIAANTDEDRFFVVHTCSS